MSKTFLKGLVVLLLLSGFTLCLVSWADVEACVIRSNDDDVMSPNPCMNVQNGDTDSSTAQSGSASSGDVVAGQVVGVGSSGNASVDATNRSEDVDVASGDALATNNSAGSTGQNITAGVVDQPVDNTQDGDILGEVAQAAEVSSGDAVGGQVIGVATSAGGVADLVLANTSEGISGSSGDSKFNNSNEEFAGQNLTLIDV